MSAFGATPSLDCASEARKARRQEIRRPSQGRPPPGPLLFEGVGRFARGEAFSANYPLRFALFRSVIDGWGADSRDPGRSTDCSSLARPRSLSRPWFALESLLLVGSSCDTSSRTPRRCGPHGRTRGIHGRRRNRLLAIGRLARIRRRMRRPANSPRLRPRLDGQTVVS